ncbi:type II secretion system protein [Vibrio sp. AND4]|uniref:type II secretion system protein n=1 Tax=Vibrio sp. AND4 TaxID=314289 RepID=UPI00015EFA02|nr:type II secretion system protein [Vibrio sp. AND4]EDP58134.1 putative MSHA pilin protein MshD [Vibrio sp. AND4]
MIKQLGITLVEMIMVIVLMGIAMAAFTSFLVPQIRDSAKPHYQTRAAALGQSFMSQILARGFDENSDFDGGLLRCGENSTSCTLPANLGPDSGESIPENFDDVDDYIGCWSTPTTVAQCQGTSRGTLSSILGTSSEDKYPNFRVEVGVGYDNLVAPVIGMTNYKKITVTVFASNTQPLKLTAIRGNY